MDVGRRQLRKEWKDPLHAPEQPDKNWRIVLPFANTYENAFGSMCQINYYSHYAKDDRLVIFLNGTEGDSEAPAEAVEWIERVGHPVAMTDFLAISFALDCDREGGDPKKPQTEIGALRGRAKPYGRNVAAAQTRKAADRLAERCVTFLNTMSCYSSADCIVAMPPSDPSKSFNLPRYLAERIAAEWGRENLSQHFVGKPRDSIKGLRGLLLLQAGAKKILGVACEKTCRNDGNIGGKI